MSSRLVAIDASLYAGTGTGDSSYWTGLIDALPEAAPDLEVLLISNHPRPELVPEGLRWIHIPSRSPRVFSLFSLPLAARRAGAQALHTQYTLSPLAHRGITTIHDVSFFVGPEWFRPKDRLLLRATVPRSALRAKKVITVSQTSKRDLVKHLPIGPSKVAVTPLAASSAFGPKPEEEISAVLSRLGVQRPYVLTVGTDWPRKNVRLAIEAVERLPESFPHRLVVTGKSGWGEKATGRRVLETGWVETEDLPALFAGAALYICPSRYEGFGIPLVESFASGTPVITSCGGALPEVAGEAAYVMKSWEPEDWAVAISDLLSDSSKLSAMRERGLARAAMFSWRDTARKTADVYREVIE